MNPDFRTLPQNREGMLAQARHAFPGFYTRATPADAALMDDLVLGQAALVVLFNAPRATMPPVIRGHFERASDVTEQLFASTRDKVRTSPTFLSLSAEEQSAIACKLFDVAVGGL